jgi:hypothetical protein
MRYPAPLIPWVRQLLEFSTRVQPPTREQRERIECALASAWSGCGDGQFQRRDPQLALGHSRPRLCRVRRKPRWGLSWIRRLLQNDQSILRRNLLKRVNVSPGSCLGEES